VAVSAATLLMLKIMKHFLSINKLIFNLLFLALTLTACSAPPVNTHESVQETVMESDQTQFRIIAHRGARSLAPENTLPAAAKALEVGADGWELDVAMSVDGELVVLHDDTLERTSNVAQVFPDRRPWRVYDFSLDELRRLDFGTWFVKEDPFKQASDGNISTVELESFVGASIPTLREALVFTKDNQWWVNIEIKDASGTYADAVIVERVVALVEELEMQHQVLISSFNFDYLRQVKTLQPNLSIGVLTSQAVSDPLTLMGELSAQAFHPSLKVVRPEQVKLLRQAGYAVNVWTVNDESDMRDLMAMGVSGIFTDFPQLLKKALSP
jgi:glycerophosphoryl diester phosphodiesterase